MSLTPLGVPFFNHFAGNLRAMVCTQRGNPEFAPMHGIWVGRACFLLASREAQGWAAVRPFYYEVLRAELTGTEQVEDERNEQDRTEVTIALEFAIPGASYPLVQR